MSPVTGDRAPLSLKRAWASAMVELLGGPVSDARVAKVVRLVTDPRSRQEELDV